MGFGGNGLRQSHVFGHGHFFGPALGIELASEAVFLEPFAQGMAHDLAALAEGDLHDFTEPAGEKMPTDKLVDVSPLALRMSSPFNAGYWLAAA